MSQKAKIIRKWFDELAISLITNTDKWRACLDREHFTSVYPLLYYNRAYVDKKWSYPHKLTTVANFVDFMCHESINHSINVNICSSIFKHDEGKQILYCKLLLTTDIEQDCTGVIEHVIVFIQPISEISAAL